MTDQPKIGTVAWLGENAAFDCDRCGDFWSVRDIRMRGEERVCSACVDNWRPPFDPFAQIEVVERLVQMVYDGLNRQGREVRP